MFFSFNSEIVMFTYGEFCRKAGPEDTAGKRAKGAARLCCAPLRFGSGLRFQDYILPFGIGNTGQDFVSGVLNACVGLVELAGCLGSKLAQHIPIA
jgi:hypothetical protein